MRVLYEAEHVVDAYLVRNLLEQDGLPCFIRGEHLSGAAGELPLQGLVQVCVPTPCWPEARACLVAAGWVRDEPEEPQADAPAPLGPEWLPA